MEGISLLDWFVWLWGRKGARTSFWPCKHFFRPQGFFVWKLVYYLGLKKISPCKCPASVLRLSWLQQHAIGGVQRLLNLQSYLKLEMLTKTCLVWVVFFLIKSLKRIYCHPASLIWTLLCALFVQSALRLSSLLTAHGVTSKLGSLPDGPGPGRKSAEWRRRQLQAWCFSGC